MNTTQAAVQAFGSVEQARLAFAEKWQAELDALKQEAKRELGKLGVSFFSPSLAYDYMNTLNDLHWALFTGDDSHAQELRFQLDDLVKQDDRAFAAFQRQQEESTL